MKRLFALSIAAASLVLMAGCVPKLIYNKALPELKPAADKALCVVLRPTKFMTSSTFIPVYCDSKYEGGTEGNTMLTFPVDPGEHMIIADATNKSKVKFNFVAGKVYFILHTVVTISGTITINTSTFVPMEGDEATKKIESEKGKISWVQKNPEDKDDNDMKADDFEDVKKDYEKWAAESKNAADAKKEADYPGY